MKLNENELILLQGLHEDFNKAKLSLADVELQKHSILKGIENLKEHFAKHEKELIEKYGADSVINIQTGEVTEKKEK
jgi:ribosomal protein S15P/S13E